MYKTIKLIGIGLTLLIFGSIVYNTFFVDKSDPEEESLIIIEEIRQVCKVTTVEGVVVESYSYKEPKDYNLTGFVLLPSFGSSLMPKEAHLKIKATIAVGYDYTDVIYDVDLDTRTLTMINVPTDPEILSIEHEVLEFDNEAYMVRPLSDDDIVDITNMALEKIRNSENMDMLFHKAKQERFDLIDMLEIIVDNSEWSLIVSDKTREQTPNLN